MQVTRNTVDPTLLNCTGECPLCRKTITVTVPEEPYREWKRGVYIQSALPDLTDNEREFLISGICGPCFDRFTTAEK